MSSIIQTSSSVDISVFDNPSQPNKDCSDFKNCISIKRLLCSLKYYSVLQVDTNTKNQDIFMHFMKKIYGIQVLNDYNHLTRSHDHELDTIMKYATDTANIDHCKLENCAYSDRRYRVKESNTNLIT